MDCPDILLGAFDPPSVCPENLRNKNRFQKKIYENQIDLKLEFILTKFIGIQVVLLIFWFKHL